MANKEHLKLLRQGRVQWNEWRMHHPEIRPDLSGANLREADLRGTNLRGVNLRGDTLKGTRFRKTDLVEADLGGVDLTEADLTEADLSFVNLTRSDLSKADLSKADLRGAGLSVANLSGANLRGTKCIKADLSFANLSGANLRGTKCIKADLSFANLKETNLTGASIWETIFANVDLGATKGLAEIQHGGPSHIALYTVQLPRDGSALHFLRGAGVPDEWIAFYRAQMFSPIQYHSCFISYSSKDEALARRLHADLQDQGVRCWFAPEDMKIGDKIRPRIDEAIHLQDKLLLILSAASVASDWVEHEVEMALAKERKEQRPVLFPIRVDRAILDQEDRGWPALVRYQRHIGDFTNWTEPRTYQIAFERLLADLKKTG